MRPHPPPCACDDCFDALVQEADALVTALEMRLALEGIVIPKAPQTALNGETWLASTVSLDEWRAYDRAVIRHRLEAVRLILDAEALVRGERS